MAHCHKVRRRLVSFNFYQKPEAEDMLFDNSIYVFKTGRAIYCNLYEVLPKLKSGVFIHFHDVFYQFEYPKEWVYKGRN